jgi:hypothetical protein
MRRLVILTHASLATLVLSGCGSSGSSPSAPSTPTVQSTPTPAPTPAPTPTPVPRADCSGVWLIVSGNLTGYGIDVNQAADGSLSGRSIFPVRDVTGPLRGSCSASGHVNWSTDYGSSDHDSFEGDLTPAGTIDGTLTFTLPSIRFVGSAPVTLTLQHR